MKTDTPETELCGELIRAGDIEIADDGEIPCLIIKINREEVRGMRLPLYKRVAVIEESRNAALTAQLTACRSALREARDYVIDYGNEKTMAPVIERIDAALDGQSVKEAQP